MFAYLQTQTTETAVDIDSRFLNDAPLANRNWIYIAHEAPGVTPQVGRGPMITGPMSQQTSTIDARYFQLSGKYVF